LRRNGGGWVGSQMSVPKLAAGLLALAIGAAVVTALAANPEGKPEFAPMAGPQANAAPAATKSDRLVVRPKSPAHPIISACPQEPWPYGCQWRSPTRKVLRGSRPS
jgi:hypothetical protein